MKTFMAALLTIVWTLSACTSERATPQQEEKLRFAVMTFAHETCTFCPGGDSDIERWTKIREPYVVLPVPTCAVLLPLPENTRM